MKKVMYIVLLFLQIFCLPISVRAEGLSSVVGKTCIIRSAMNTNYVMDVYYGERKDMREKNIQLYHYNGGDNQHFRVINAGNNWYKIISVKTNKAVDVAGGVAGNEVNVQLWGQNGTSAQLFKFESAGGGYYYIKSRLGYYLDVYGAQCRDEINIQTYRKNGGNNQKWLLTAVDTNNSNNSSMSDNTDNTINFNGHRYQLFNDGRDWDNAKMYCQNIGGHLVTIESREEQTAIEHLLRTKGNRNSYWIGGYKDWSGQWLWVTGERLTYTNWAPWQPDNPGVEDKLMMYRMPNPNSTSYLGQWNDLRANGTYPNESFFGLQNFGFICEWEDTRKSRSILNASWEVDLTNEISFEEIKTYLNPFAYNIFNESGYGDEVKYPTPGKKYLVRIDYIDSDTVFEMIRHKSLNKSVLEQIKELIAGDAKNAGIEKIAITILNGIGVKNVPGISTLVGVLEIFASANEQKDWNNFAKTTQNGQGIKKYTYVNFSRTIPDSSPSGLYPGIPNFHYSIISYKTYHYELWDGQANDLSDLTTAVMMLHTGKWTYKYK